MSWDALDLRGDILIIFAEAQRLGFARISNRIAQFEAAQDAWLKRKKDKANALYRSSDKRKQQVAAAQRTPRARLLARARYHERKQPRDYSTMSEEAKAKQRARAARYRESKRSCKQ